MCAIFLKHGEKLVEMLEQPYEAEHVLQQLLADYPNLLAWDQDSEARTRWLLVQRELGIASVEGAPDRWSLDHLFLDDEGVPTLIEVKRSSDTRIRREVVGQMLDYAANGAELWGLEKIRTAFESGYQNADQAAEALVAFLAGAEEPEHYWERVGVNLKAGKLRLIFVADVMPAELRRVVEFLNEQMERTEVLALEVRQYLEAGGDRVILVPRLIGQTEAARQTKGAGPSKRRPNLTYEELKELAVRAGVGDLYEYAVAALGAVLQKQTTRSSIRFAGSFDGSRKVVISLLPSESTMDDGLRYQLYRNRLAELVKPSGADVESLVPQPREYWIYLPNAGPDYEGFQGFIKKREQVDRLAGALRVIAARS